MTPEPPPTDNTWLVMEVVHKHRFLRRWRRPVRLTQEQARALCAALETWLPP